MNIVFVCKGNVGRSQIAEALFIKKFGTAHHVSSAGTKISGPEQPLGELMPAVNEVLSVMNEEGIDVSQAIRHQLTEQMVNDADKVIVILEENEEVPDYLVHSPNIERWSVADPKGKDIDATRIIKDQIKQRIDAMLV
ncbi:MAG: hypothetical protein RL094_727 [Candidatus Parcubacteria bacterium]|jgi:protein-tyrosine-phosphatase